MSYDPKSLSAEALFIEAPEVRSDPYPLLSELRGRGPVLETGLGLWVVTGFEDAHALLLDPRASSDERNSEGAEMQPGPVGPWSTLTTRSLFFVDAPRHTRLRAFAGRAADSVGVEALAARIREAASRLVQDIEPKGEGDLMAAVASPLSLIAIGEFLGIPEDHREQLSTWAQHLPHQLLVTLLRTPEMTDRADEAIAALGGYIGELLPQRRDHPGNDFLSAIVLADEEGRRLTDQEVIEIVTLVLVGGVHPLAYFIGNGILALLQNPTALAQVRGALSSTERAVEELLRFDSPILMAGRVLLDEIEVGGKKIPKGKTVAALLGAANRDPARFSEPEQLDLERRDNKHLAFGAGGHHCLGASLVRMVGGIATEVILTQLPSLRLAAESIEWGGHIALRGPKALPVRWSRST